MSPNFSRIFLPKFYLNLGHPGGVSDFIYRTVVGSERFQTFPNSNVPTRWGARGCKGVWDTSPNFAVFFSEVTPKEVSKLTD